MRQIEPDGYAPHGYVPHDVPWGGNGWWFADGDVLGAALGLELAARILPQGTDILAQAAQTALKYGSDDQRREIVTTLTPPGTL